MYQRPFSRLLIASSLWPALIVDCLASPAEHDSLSEITVSAKRLASDSPAGSYATLATDLRFDAVVDLQSRGLPEGQGDLTVRGGLFENTGIKIGAINLFGPQTGHYVADVPIPPEYLSLRDVRTGIDNVISGFNSNVATLEYALTPIVHGGSLSLGAGSDSLNYHSLHVATVFGRSRDGRGFSGRTVGAALSYASSEGDGSLANGDHEFERVALRLQHRDRNSQTDAMIAYQDKFYGWPGAYTGFASLAETDHTKTTLVLVNHRHSARDRDWWEVGGFYRALGDDYDFDRFNKIVGGPGAFDHETRAYGLSAQGSHALRGLDWRYSAQVIADELVYSTDLTEGDFSRRRYASFSLTPEKRYQLPNGAELKARAGLSYDISNRDSSAVSPLIGAVYEKRTEDGVLRYRIEYAASSQLPGYTVLKSRPSGLFGGNANLGREKARTLELGVEKETADWLAQFTIFAREDDDLVDWTYLSGAPFARQANAVDIDVAGAELFIARRWPQGDIAFGYAYLHKDADYGIAAVDASYYALNFAKHRVTLAAYYRLTEQIEIRLHSEYRNQYDNPLRTGSSDAFNASVGIAWQPAFAERLMFSLTGDNLTNSKFEQFPGTPAAGRQVALSGRYDW